MGGGPRAPAGNFSPDSCEAMLDTNFDELRRLLVQQSRELTAMDPDFQSTEWYVLKYLRRIERSLESGCGPERMENSMRGLVRFYVDRVETSSGLGQRCLAIYEVYRRSRRNRESSR